MRRYFSKVLIRISIIMLFSVLVSSPSLGALSVSLSDQGTGVTVKSGGQIVTLGNLTVEMWDSSTGGNIIYNETFVNEIVNGSWNVMLGETTDLSLEYGKEYYKDYKINGEDASFTNNSGGTIDRQSFYSPMGEINATKLMNNSIDSSKLILNINLSQAIGYLWTSIAGIPAGFSDGTDDGLTSESDPVFTAGNASIWTGINNKLNLSGGTISGDLIISGVLTTIGGYTNLSVTNVANNGSMIPDQNGIFDIGNSSFKWHEIYADTLLANINASYILNPPWLTSYTETDPIFVAANSSIWTEIDTKLDITDQRYNETTAMTALITSVNDSLSSLKLNVSDQRYNETARVDALNITKGNASIIGTAGYIAQIADPRNLSNSVIYQNASNIGIGTTAPTQKLEVNGNLKVNQNISVGDVTIYNSNGVLKVRDTHGNVTAITIFPMGEYSVTNNNVATVVTSSGVCVRFNTTGVFNTDSIDFYSNATGRLIYNGSGMRMFHIATTLSLKDESTNDIVRALIYKNGVVNANNEFIGGTALSKGTIQEKLLIAGDIKSTAIHVMTDMSQGDYLELALCNDGSAGDLTVTYMNMFAMGVSMGMD